MNQKVIQCPNCKEKVVVSSRTKFISCNCGAIWNQFDKKWRVMTDWAGEQVLG